MSCSASRGSALIEALVSAFIGLALVASASAALAASIHSLTKAYQRARGAYTALRVRSLLQRIADDIDATRVGPPPRNHMNGEITFSDGSQNPVMTGTAARRPLPGSHAVTGMRLATMRAQFVLEKTGTPSSVQAHVCPRFGNALDRSDDRSFLAITPDGAAEATGRAASGGAHRKCSDVELTRADGMLPGATDFDLRFVDALVPIDSLYTLYLSEDRELRLLGHRGRSNIENQPILRHVEGLMLSAETSRAGTLALRAEITPQGGMPWRLQAGAHLALVPPHTIFLNRP